MSGIVEPELPGKIGGRASSTVWGRRLLSFVVLLAAVVIGSAIRIQTTLSDPNFDTRNARPVLRSDPALLYYITERIIEGGGLPPEDFRADPRVEYPEVSDLPAMFTVSQEFLVAWLYLVFGGGMPLHVFCVWAMGVFASLAVVGVYGLAMELTRSVRWAALAAGLWLVLEANYRTIGFVLIREDFSIPWLSLHLFCAARAVRTRKPLDFAWTAVTLVPAVSSWHAMSFVAAIEAACIFAWFLRTGQSPLAARRAWLIPLILAAASLVVPVLHSRAFILSLPMQIIAAMLVAALVQRGGRRSSMAARGTALAVLGMVLVGTFAASGVSEGGLAHYSHVVSMMKAKVLHLGVLPADPSSMPFEARLLWDGPFETASLRFLLGGFGVMIVMPLVACGFAIRGWLTGRGDPLLMVLMAFLAVTALSAYLVSRTVIVAGLAAPVAAVVVLARLRRGSLRDGLIVAAGALQLYVFAGWVKHHEIAWYLPPSRNADLAAMVDWVERNIPAEEPIAADFVTSTAILAHTRHPIILQPKYETVRTRRRIEEFLVTFAHGTPAEFQAWLAKYRCRYLVVHPLYSWGRYQYVTGTPPPFASRPIAGTTAEALLRPGLSAPSQVGEYRLVYASPPATGGMYRVYQVK